jgi:hypothetical protein
MYSLRARRNRKDVSTTKNTLCVLFCGVKWRKHRHRYKMSTMLASQFDWEKVVPVYRKPLRMIYVDSVETALSVGDFVVVSSTISASGKRVVGRIIDIDKEREKCLLNWWNYPSAFPILSPHIPSVSSTDFQFIVACSVPELLQSVDCCWINASDVLDVAFVFHVESVGNCSFDCYGMRNAFFCRYRYRIQLDDDVEMEALSAATHAPFGNMRNMGTNIGTQKRVMMPVSYPSRVWYGLMSMRQVLLDPMLNRTAQHQTTNNQSLSAYTSVEAFLHLTRGVTNSTLHFLEVKRCRTLRWPDLSLSSVSNTWDVALLRIRSSEALAELRQTIGIRAGVGIRKRLFGKHERVLGCNEDIANIVVFAEESDDEEDTHSPRLRTREQGIDFVFFVSSSTMSVRVRYQREALRHEIVKEYLRDASVGMRSTGSVPAAGEVPIKEHIRIGTPFLYNAKVLFVSQVDILNDIVVGYEEKSGSQYGEPAIICYDDALHAIQLYCL